MGCGASAEPHRDQRNATNADCHEALSSSRLSGHKANDRPHPAVVDDDVTAPSRDDSSDGEEAAEPSDFSRAVSMKTRVLSARLFHGIDGEPDQFTSHASSTSIYMDASGTASQADSDARVRRWLRSPANSDSPLIPVVSGPDDARHDDAFLPSPLTVLHNTAVGDPAVVRPRLTAPVLFRHEVQHRATPAHSDV